MGQIAEDMLDGSACSLCGCYFKHPDHPDSIYVHEYPVVCRDCWADLTDEQRKMHQKAEVETF